METGITPFMLHRVILRLHTLGDNPLFRLAALICGAGTVAGVTLWVGGVDIALQSWLWDHYNQDFNNHMRILGELGKGTAQAGMILAFGAGWAVWSYMRSGGISAGAKACLMAIPVFLMSGIVNWLLKFVIGRPRPKEFLMNGGDPWGLEPFSFKATFWSFPSGHACSTWAIAVWLMLIFPKARIPLFVVAVVLSASRFLAITPHYLGDVVAGGAVGAAVALVCFDVAKRRGMVCRLG
jgi:membrane-associated phospholipid phosphatase